MPICTKEEFYKKLNGVFELCSLPLPTVEQSEKLYCLSQELCEYGKNVNLTAITDIDGIILKHIADCASMADIPQKNARVLDVGAGGGFPSLPIAILRQDVRVISLDSTSKKLVFIDRMANIAKLNNISTLHARAEEASNGPLRESFDFVCARAVASMPMLCELCLPFVKKGGIFCAMRSANEDVSECNRAVTTLGGKISQVKEFSLTDGDQTVSRTLIIIEKVSHTPDTYPRKFSNIKAKPIV